jgi:hypothetical protein
MSDNVTDHAVDTGAEATGATSTPDEGGTEATARVDDSPQRHDRRRDCRRVGVVGTVVIAGMYRVDRPAR